MAVSTQSLDVQSVAASEFDSVGTLTPGRSGGDLTAAHVPSDPFGLSKVQHTRDSTPIGDNSKTSPGSGVFVKRYTPNMFAANIIVLSDFLNALGSGFSLRFIDLFLIQEYNASPEYVLLIAFLECCCGVCVTPAAQKLMFKSRMWGYHAKTSVILMWSLSLLFLGILCVPGMSLAAVVPAVVLMQSLNSSTKAYTDAKLVSYLPQDRIAMYMVWDSLIKASQGGIAICGAMVISSGSYQRCFACTFGILLFRLLIYGAFTADRLSRSKVKGAMDSTPTEEYHDVEPLGDHPVEGDKRHSSHTDHGELDIATEAHDEEFDDLVAEDSEDCGIPRSPKSPKKHISLSSAFEAIPEEDLEEPEGCHSP